MSSLLQAWRKHQPHIDRLGDDGFEEAPQLQVVEGLKNPRRSYFLAFIGLLTLGTLIAVLMLNISVYQTQYQVIQMANEKVELQDRIEAVRKEISRNQAPQNLMRQAEAMGMVQDNDPAFIDVASGKVIGDTAPAAAKAKEKDYTPVAEVGTDGSTDGTGGMNDVSTNRQYTHDELNGGTIPAPQQQTPPE